MLGILAERRRADEALEAAPSSRIHNHLSAAGLANLFDERKQCTSQAELDDLSREYGMDPAVVNKLARHINTPSDSEIAREFRVLGVALDGCACEGESAAGWTNVWKGCAPSLFVSEAFGKGSTGRP